VPEKYHQKIKDRRTPLRNKEELGFVEIELIHKDGSLIPVELNNRTIKVGNTDCWLTVIRDLRDRKLLQQKLVDTIIETEEKERRKFAGDLHDELGPQLAAMRIYASSLKRRIVDTEQLKLFDELMEMIKKSITNVREISSNLSPHLLDTYGLVAAIESEVDIKRAVFSVNFEQNINETRFELNKEIALYRIVKELLNNTMKYARATRVDILLKFLSNRLELTYTDNGVGFDINEVLKNKHSGIGLLNIQYRISSLQGNCSIFSNTNQGFSLHIDFPALPITI
jgi:signal transduction histidine kinase